MEHQHRYQGFPPSLSPVFWSMYSHISFWCSQIGSEFSSYEFIHIHTIDCGWSLDPLLLAVHENGHVFFSPVFLNGFLLWTKFLLLSCHLRSGWKQFIHSLRVSPLSGVHDEYDSTHTCSLLRMSQLCRPIVARTWQ